MKKRQNRNAGGAKTSEPPVQYSHVETPVPGNARAGTLERIVRLRIVCKAPPDPEHHGATFGLQDNSSAAAWVLHSGKRKPNGDVHFECEVRVRPNARSGDPNFLGDFAHGTAEQRFLYLSWRPKDWRPGHPEPSSPRWQRRMKIHLSTITWEMIEEASLSSCLLEAAVEGTGKDGGPNCASVPLLGNGWKVERKG